MSPPVTANMADVSWPSGSISRTLDDGADRANTHPCGRQDAVSRRTDSEATLVQPILPSDPKHSISIFSPDPELDPESTTSPPARLQKIHRKIDLRITFIYCVTYLILKVSERNITNVAILNSESDTSNIKSQLGHLTSDQWAWIVSAFFFTYMSFEPVSVLLLKIFSPRFWMARILVTWGVISACQAASTSFGGLLTCRVLLGWAEAGFGPGMLYHLSFWFPAERLTMRVSLLAAAGMVSGTFSGSLAYGISFLNRAGGLAGWRWIFIIEGLPAVVLGIIMFIWLPNYPQTAGFLSADEKKLVIANLPSTQPTVESKTFVWEELRDLVLHDITFWSFQLLWVAHGMGAGGISRALPAITYQLGLEDSSLSQLLTMPPFALGCALTLGVGAVIHIKGCRPWVLALILEIVVLITYILLITVRSPVARYCLVLVAIACAMAVLPILWPGESIFPLPKSTGKWLTCHPERVRACQGTTSTGFAIGLTSAVAHTAGLAGPHIYQTKFGPSYRTSYTICIGLVAVTILAIAFTWIIVRRRESAAQTQWTAGVQDGERVEESVENE